MTESKSSQLHVHNEIIVNIIVHMSEHVIVSAVSKSTHGSPFRDKINNRLICFIIHMHNNSQQQY